MTVPGSSRLIAENAKLQKRVAELEATLREIGRAAGAKIARDRRRRYADPDEIAGRLGADGRQDRASNAR